MKDTFGITLKPGDQVRSPALGRGVVGFVTEFNETIIDKSIPAELREKFYERRTVTVSTIDTLTRCLDQLTLAPYNFEIIQ